MAQVSPIGHGSSVRFAAVTAFLVRNRSNVCLSHSSLHMTEAEKGLISWFRENSRKVSPIDLVTAYPDGVTKRTKKAVIANGPVLLQTIHCIYRKYTINTQKFPQQSSKTNKELGSCQSEEFGSDIE